MGTFLAVPTIEYAQMSGKVSYAASQMDGGLVLEYLFNGGSNVAGLRQNLVFELGLVGAESVLGGDAAHRRVEFVEKFVGDARGDFRAVAPGTHVFVGDDDAVGLAHARGDGFPVVRRKRAQIDNFHRNAFALQFEPRPLPRDAPARHK